MTVITLAIVTVMTITIAITMGDYRFRVCAPWGSIEYLGYIGDHGKEHGNYYSGLYRV